MCSGVQCLGLRAELQSGIDVVVKFAGPHNPLRLVMKTINL